MKAQRIRGAMSFTTRCNRCGRSFTSRTTTVLTLLVHEHQKVDCRKDTPPKAESGELFG